MNTKKIRLAALDMDGTLLRPDKSVDPETVRDIDAACAAGVYVVYGSGRALAELAPYAEQLKSMRYAVCMSGSLVYDMKERRPVCSRPVSREYVRAIVAAAKRMDAMVHFLTEKESIVCRNQVDRMEEYHMGIYQSMFQAIARKADDMAAEAERLPAVEKINVYCRKEADRRELYEELKHLPLSFALAEETNLEMTAENVTKGTGLKLLAEYLGIPMEETMAVGDADNDRAMLKAAGLSVAMGNAAPEIRALCAAVTADNAHNGAGQALRKYCL